MWLARAGTESRAKRIKVTWLDVGRWQSSFAKNLMDGFEHWDQLSKDDIIQYRMMAEAELVRRLVLVAAPHSSVSSFHGNVAGGGGAWNVLLGCGVLAAMG